MHGNDIFCITCRRQFLFWWQALFLVNKRWEACRQVMLASFVISDWHSVNLQLSFGVWVRSIRYVVSSTPLSWSKNCEDFCPARYVGLEVSFVVSEFEGISCNYGLHKNALCGSCRCYWDLVPNNIGIVAGPSSLLSTNISCQWIWLLWDEGSCWQTLEPLCCLFGLALVVACVPGLTVLSWWRGIQCPPLQPMTWHAWWSVQCSVQLHYPLDLCCHLTQRNVFQPIFLLWVWLGVGDTCWAATALKAMSMVESTACL